jgi:hypothetical protein
METFYSPSTGGFYHKTVHGKNMPVDIVSVSTQKYEELMVGQALGKQITPSEGGMPELTEYIPSTETLKEVERSWRNSELFRADVGLYKAQDSDPKASGSVAAWREYRKALRAWPDHKEFPNIEFRPVAPDV